MDLQLYIRVLWRFRVLLIAGLLIGFTLAFFSLIQIRFDGGLPRFSYREARIWQSQTTIFVTQKGFPWGRLQPTAGESGSQAGDTSRFSNLALIYSELARSDAVQQMMLKQGPINGSVQATAIPNANDSRFVLPLIEILATATSPEIAVSLADRASDALMSYVRQQQDANSIPSAERTTLSVLNRPAGAVLVAGRSFTRPTIIFVTTLMAVIALIFVLENLRPRVRAVRTPDSASQEDESRRTA